MSFGELLQGGGSANPAQCEGGVVDPIQPGPIHPILTARGTGWSGQASKISMKTSLGPLRAERAQLGGWDGMGWGHRQVESNLWEQDRWAELGLGLWGSDRAGPGHICDPLPLL